MVPLIAAREREGVLSERPLPAQVWVGELPGDAQAASDSADRSEACALLYSRAGEIQILPPTPARELAQSAGSVHGWGVVFSRAALSKLAAAPLSDWDDAIDADILIRTAWLEPRRYQLGSVARPAWEARIERLQTELDRAPPGHRVAAAALLTLLMIDAARLVSPVTPGAPAQLRDLVTDIAAVIDRRFSERLTLADVASAVAVSPPHLSRLVRRATNRTVGEWIRDRRMEEARRLLRNTDASVESIAMSIGYRDITHFRRHFQRAHDTTPARWRQRARPDLASRIR